jgi:hypothetical protein
LAYSNSDWLVVILEGGRAQERVDISSDCRETVGGAYVTGYTEREMQLECSI